MKHVLPKLFKPVSPIFEFDFLVVAWISVEMSMTF